MRMLIVLIKQGFRGKSPSKCQFLRVNVSFCLSRNAAKTGYNTTQFDGFSSERKTPIRKPIRVFYEPFHSVSPWGGANYSGMKKRGQKEKRESESGITRTIADHLGESPWYHPGRSFILSAMSSDPARWLSATIKKATVMQWNNLSKLDIQSDF